MKGKRISEDPLRRAFRLNEVIAAVFRYRGLEWDPERGIGFWVEYGDGSFWFCDGRGKTRLARSQATEEFIRTAAQVLTEPPEERQARLAAQLAAESVELERSRVGGRAVIVETPDTLDARLGAPPRQGPRQLFRHLRRLFRRR